MEIENGKKKGNENKGLQKNQKREERWVHEDLQDTLWSVFINLQEIVYNGITSHAQLSDKN